MEKLIIEGGNKLVGEIKISGSKNAALPILFATLLTDEKVVLNNVPRLKDIDTAISIIEFLGKKAIWENNKLIISTIKNPPKEKGYIIAPYELIKKMRASFLVSGALLAKHKKVKVALPGGCAIGLRPVDIHIEAFEKLGCSHYIEEGYEVFIRDNLKPATIKFRYPSVGATENVLLISSTNTERVVIQNVAKEPEVQDLINFLKLLGVNIQMLEHRTIIIEGTKKFNKGPFVYTIIPDRIETGTYMIAAGVTKGEILLKNVIPEHLNFVIRKLVSTGLKIELENDKIYLHWEKNLKPQNITTRPYPYFPTDLQAQYMTLMSITKGTSVITETVFENRFLHVPELQRMGANITVNGRKAYIHGVEKLIGCEVTVSDLRAGAALVLAGLCAEGKSIITNIHHLDRGYESLETKLSLLGAKIKRIKN